jgi:cytochrome b561
MVLGLLAIARIGWRLSHPAPAWPASMPDWERRAARIAHAAMHVCMVIVPLSGWVASNFIKYGVDFFGLVKMPPFGSPSPAVYAFFNGLHDIGAWLLSALVCVHVIAALKHALVDRDGLFSRMWTFQSKEGATQ